MRTLACLIVLCLAWSPAPLRAEDTHTPLDWYRPETIDPLRADIGDFLDADLSEYHLQAALAYKQGEYKKAARFYLHILRHDINDFLAIYNLACCYGLLERADLAALYLKRAVHAGFRNLQQIAEDADFTAVRKKPVFTRAMTDIRAEIPQTDTLPVAGPRLFSCLLLQPADTQRRPPLLVGLHGYGGNPDNFAFLWHDIKDMSLLFCVPRAPYPLPVGRNRFSWSDAWGDEQLAARSLDLAEEYLLRVIAEARSHYRVGPVYVLGFSQGAALAYRMALRHPDALDGVICFCGLSPRNIAARAPAAGKLPPVCIAMGRDDPGVPATAARDARNILTAKGYTVKVLAFDGGHMVYPRALLDALQWLENKGGRQEPQPAAGTVSKQ